MKRQFLILIAIVAFATTLTTNNDIIVANHSNEGERQTPILVFQKYGENYFLTEISLGTEWGYSIRPSPRQRESEKTLALASLEKN